MQNMAAQLIARIDAKITQINDHLADVTDRIKVAQYSHEADAAEVLITERDKWYAERDLLLERRFRVQQAMA